MTAFRDAPGSASERWPVTWRSTWLGQRAHQGPGAAAVRGHLRAARQRGRDRARRRRAVRRRAAARAHRIEVLDPPARTPTPSRPTSCCSRPAARRGCSRRPSPTASESCRGARSTSSTELPEHLIVIGSGVTGAEFASGYSELGVPVTLVSSAIACCRRGPDAAEVIEQVFTSRGGTLVKRARASAVKRVGDGVVVEMPDGRTVQGSHALMCVGSVPNWFGLGLESVGIELDERGYIAGRPRVAHGRAVDLCRRRLHGRAAAGVGGRHAGTDRDVARARRGGHAAAAEDGRRQRVHPPRDRDGRDRYEAITPARCRRAW